MNMPSYTSVFTDATMHQDAPDIILSTLGIAGRDVRGGDGLRLLQRGRLHPVVVALGAEIGQPFFGDEINHVILSPLSCKLGIVTFCGTKGV